MKCDLNGQDGKVYGFQDCFVLRIFINTVKSLQSIIMSILIRITLRCKSEIYIKILVRESFKYWIISYSIIFGNELSFPAILLDL